MIDIILNLIKHNKLEIEDVPEKYKKEIIEIIEKNEDSI